MASTSNSNHNHKSHDANHNWEEPVVRGLVTTCWENAGRSNINALRDVLISQFPDAIPLLKEKYGKFTAFIHNYPKIFQVNSYDKSVKLVGLPPGFTTPVPSKVPTKSAPSHQNLTTESSVQYVEHSNPQVSKQNAPQNSSAEASFSLPVAIPKPAPAATTANVSDSTLTIMSPRGNSSAIRRNQVGTTTPAASTSASSSSTTSTPAPQTPRAVAFSSLELWEQMSVFAVLKHLLQSPTGVEHFSILQDKLNEPQLLSKYASLRELLCQFPGIFVVDSKGMVSLHDPTKARASYPVLAAEFEKRISNPQVPQSDTNPIAIAIHNAPTIWEKALLKTVWSTLISQPNHSANFPWLTTTLGKFKPSVKSEYGSFRIWAIQQTLFKFNGDTIYIPSSVAPPSSSNPRPPPPPPPINRSGSTYASVSTAAFSIPAPPALPPRKFNPSAVPPAPSLPSRRVGSHPISHTLSHQPAPPAHSIATPSTLIHPNSVQFGNNRFPANVHYAQTVATQATHTSSPSLDSIFAPLTSAESTTTDNSLDEFGRSRSPSKNGHQRQRSASPSTSTTIRPSNASQVPVTKRHSRSNSISTVPSEDHHVEHYEAQESSTGPVIPLNPKVPKKLNIPAINSIVERSNSEGSNHPSNSTQKHTSNEGQSPRKSIPQLISNIEREIYNTPFTGLQLNHTPVNIKYVSTPEDMKKVAAFFSNLTAVAIYAELIPTIPKSVPEFHKSNPNSPPSDIAISASPPPSNPKVLLAVSSRSHLIAGSAPGNLTSPLDAEDHNTANGEGTTSGEQSGSIDSTIIHEEDHPLASDRDHTEDEQASHPMEISFLCLTSRSSPNTILTASNPHLEQFKPHPVFIVDFRKQPKHAKIFKHVLQSNSILKTVYNSPQLAKCLYENHGIRLNHIMDIQVLHRLLWEMQTLPLRWSHASGFDAVSESSRGSFTRHHPKGDAHIPQLDVPLGKLLRHYDLCFTGIQLPATHCLIDATISDPSNSTPKNDAKWILPISSQDLAQKAAMIAALYDLKTHLATQLASSMSRATCQLSHGYSHTLITEFQHSGDSLPPALNPLAHDAWIDAPELFSHLSPHD